MSETTSATDVAPTNPNTTFSAEYVKELRAENKQTRLRAQELETALQQAQDASKKLAEDYASKHSSLTEQAQAAMTRSELKVHALKAGMVDLDGLKLLDLSKIKLNDEGEIENADAILKAAKDSKPWLFGVTNNTTSTSQPPKPAEVKTKSALEMSDEELRSFEKQYGIITHSA